MYRSIEKRREYRREYVKRNPNKRRQYQINAAVNMLRKAGYTVEKNDRSTED